MAPLRSGVQYLPNSLVAHAIDRVTRFAEERIP